MKKILLAFLVLLLVAGGVWAADSALVQQAKEDYLFQLEKYRQEYAVFDTKRRQYNNLQTFASQEEMVNTAKPMLERRGEVWFTYFQLLRTRLHELKGIDVNKREELILLMVSQQQAVRAHQDRLKPLEKTEEILAEAQRLDELHKQFERDSYEVMANQAVAEIQTAVDMIEVLSDKIYNQLDTQILNADVVAARKRGFEDVYRSLDLAVATLQEVRDDLPQEPDEGVTDTQYQRMVAELLPAHQQVSRAYELLEELSVGIEL